MSVSQTANVVEHEYLRTLYELADGRAKNAVPYVDVCAETGRSEKEAEQACDFWADRGILEWTALGHIALTHIGLRRAEHLASRGWSFAPF